MGGKLGANCRFSVVNCVAESITAATPVLGSPDCGVVNPVTVVVTTAAVRVSAYPVYVLARWGSIFDGSTRDDNFNFTMHAPLF